MSDNTSDNETISDEICEKNKGSQIAIRSASFLLRPSFLPSITPDSPHKSLCEMLEEGSNPRHPPCKGDTQITTELFDGSMFQVNQPMFRPKSAPDWIRTSNLEVNSFLRQLREGL